MSAFFFSFKIRALFFFLFHFFLFLLDVSTSFSTSFDIEISEFGFRARESWESKARQGSGNCLVEPRIGREKLICDWFCCCRRTLYRGDTISAEAISGEAMSGEAISMEANGSMPESLEVRNSVFCL